MNIKYKSLLLIRFFYILVCFLNGSVYANEGTGAFQKIFKSRLTQVKAGELPAVEPCLSEIVRKKQFVLYPGKGGNKADDVFGDNRRALIDDFGADPQDFVIRDIEAYYHQIRPSINAVSSNEPLYLKELYRQSAERNEGQGKPLVLVAHSAHGIEMFYGILSMYNELKEGGIIDRVIFIESSIYYDSRWFFNENFWDWARRQFGFEVDSIPSEYAAHDVKRIAKESPEVITAAKKKILFIGKGYYGKAPTEFGSSLGDIQDLDHISQVVSEARSGTPYIYRQAFTRALMESAYSNCAE